MKHMREIGGYLEFEHFNGREYHENAAALNLARNAVAYLAKEKNYQKVYIPYFLCGCIRAALQENAIDVSCYETDEHCKPVLGELQGEHEAVLVVNHYGQLGRDEIDSYFRKWNGRVILDNTHDFFADRVPGVDTVYSARKYFGIPDGAYLYAEKLVQKEFPRSGSYDRVRHLVGRYEKRADDFYGDYLRSEELLDGEGLKEMSPLSRNILRGIDYGEVRKRREGNFLYLHKKLSGINLWKLKDEPGTYMYPLWVGNGFQLRKELQKSKIYVPVLWPNVMRERRPSDLEYRMAANILPLPIDQRYTLEDMEYLCRNILWRNGPWI